MYFNNLFYYKYDQKSRKSTSKTELNKQHQFPVASSYISHGVCWELNPNWD